MRSCLVILAGILLLGSTAGQTRTSLANCAALGGVPFLKSETRGVSFFASAQASPYTIGANIQVSTSQSSLRHYESYAGSDPKRANRLIACAFVVLSGGEIDNVFYVSNDRGQTWEHMLTVPNSVDPSCEIGRKGVLFASSVHDQKFADGKTDSVLSVYRSRNGRNWQPSIVRVETRGIDRAYLTADSTSRRFSNLVYAHGYHSSKTPTSTVLFYPSSDDGKSFHNLIKISPTTFPHPWFFPANGVVANDGTFLALLAELDDTKRNMSYRTDPASAPSENAVLDIIQSHDGGKSAAVLSKIPGVYYDWRVPNLSMPGLAVDRSSGEFRDRLYAVWPDARFEHRTQILFADSSDGGLTWSEPQIISDDSRSERPNKEANNFMPAIAVNKDGIVGMSWYDRRDNPDNVGYWVRFSASRDGGKTWLPSVRVSTAPNIASDDTRKNSGDTAGLTADANGLFHPVWIDNRTGIPQMWTAAVQVYR